MNAFGIREDHMCQLQNVGVQADLADKMWNYRFGAMLLNFAREVRFRNPRRAEAEFVGQPHLIEKIIEHDFFARQVSVDFRLANREKQVELHSAPVRPPSTGNITPET